MVWVNGAFGVGKTTTALQIAEKESRFRLFDPEWVGYLLRHHLADQELADFQELPGWRRLVPIVADELIDSTGQDLLAVQTVLVEDYWHELATRLRALGHKVIHVVLDVAEDVLFNRIDGDEMEAGPAEWRRQHIAQFIGARPWLIESADIVVDTSRIAPDDSVLQILAGLHAAGRAIHP